jgi:hypothetical protein
MGTNYIAPIWRMPQNANKDKLSNYSIDFGTTAQYISTPSTWQTDVGLDNVKKLSFSVWVKPTATTGASGYEAITSQAYGSWNGNFNITYRNDTTFPTRLALEFRGVTGVFLNNNTTLTPDTWSHICFVIDLTLGGTLAQEVRCFVNNSEVANQGTATPPLNFVLQTTSFNIGRTRWGSGSSGYQWNGGIAQACFFDYTLSENQIGYLYNLNNPMAITGGEPVAYWPLGDNSNPNADAGYPNISVGADSVFEFGTQRYVERLVPGESPLGISGAITFSGWFKTSETTGYANIIGEDSFGPATRRNWVLLRRNNEVRAILFPVNGSGGTIKVIDTTGLTVGDGQWHFALATWDGTTNADAFKLFVDGVLRAQGTTDFTVLQTGYAPLSVSDNSAGYDLIGQATNAQVWDTNLTYGTASALGDIAGGEVAELYNNGQPLMSGTQPQEDNLKVWWKLNQSANYDPGVGPFSIEKVGSPDDGSGNGCFTSGGQLKWIDTNSQLLSENDYFTFLSPLILCNSTDVDLSSTGGAFQSASSQLEYALEYSIDGGSWTTWKTQVVSSGTPVTNWTVSAASNLTCNSSIQVRLRATGGLFGTSQFNWNDLEIKVNNNRVYFETFGTNGLGWTNGSYTAPTDNYIDPSWQIPDNRSAYPQSFNFDGNDDFVSTNFNVDNYTNLTYSVWVNPTSLNQRGGLASLSSVNNFVTAFWDGSGGRFYVYIGNVLSQITGIWSGSKFGTLGQEKWLHIAVVYDGSGATDADRLKVYADGDYVAFNILGSIPTSIPSGGGDLIIGKWSTAEYDGKMSNVMLFDSSLPATGTDSVETLYNNGVPLTTAIATDNLKGWWKLDNTANYINYPQNLTFTPDYWSINPDNITPGATEALNFSGGYQNLPGVYEGIEFNDTPLTDNKFIMSFWYNPTKAIDDGSYIYHNYSGGIISIGFFTNSFNVYADPTTIGNHMMRYYLPNTKTGWHHLVIYMNQGSGSTVDLNNTDNLRIYVDGSELSVGLVLGDVSASPVRTEANRLGWTTAGNFEGFQFSNLSLLVGDNAVLSAIPTLYNGGTPGDISSLNPTWWYKLNSSDTSFPTSTPPTSADNVFTVTDSSGNGNTTTGPFYYAKSLTLPNQVPSIQTVDVVSNQGISSGLTEQSLVNNNVSVLNGESEGMNSTNLVTSNISRTQPYSKYSFNFDRGQADFFDLGTDSSMDVFSSDFSCSVWFNHTDTSGGANGILEFSTFTQKFGMQLGFTTNTGVSFSFGPNPSQPWSYNGGSGYNDGNWHNFIVTKNGSSLKGYVDGVELTFSTGSITLGGFNAIGKGRNTPTYFNGKLSNCCLFDRSLTEQEILKIYNNGLTQDLQTTSSFSNNIAAWWPMDENSSYYDGTDWVIRDLENGNDGDGNNTGNVDDLVGNAPGSEASGTGNNLAIADLKGNMYNSDKNAYSINMADYADSVTNPANSGRSTDTP